MIIAIDPGTTQSAYCFIDESLRYFRAGIVENQRMLEILANQRNVKMAIEMVASYGMPVGAEVFETCVWAGRFIQAHGGEHVRIKRQEVKLHICKSSRANDSTIRAALIDRFGKPGTKKAPGLLYGISKDMWSALAVGVTAIEKPAMVVPRA